MSQPFLTRHRWAPSPTGRLHLGNLFQLALCHAHARHRGGILVLRVEDLDRTRCHPDWTRALQEDLTWLGLAPDHPWDEALHQQTRDLHYTRALDTLRRRGLAYPCTCSRRDIALAQQAPHGAPRSGARYPGTCRPPEPMTGPPPAAPHAWRLRCAGTVHFHDGILGPSSRDLDALGDPVLCRRDGLFAYQLAVVVDDAFQGITDVLRGHDLLESTALQIAVGQALDLPIPRFHHTPLLVDSRGHKLSKRDASAGVPALRSAGWTPQGLLGALAWLAGLQPLPAPCRPADLAHAWDPRRLACASIEVPDALWQGPEALHRHADIHPPRRQTDTVEAQVDDTPVDR
jgi:glutamyl-tRNA synthetase